MSLALIITYSSQGELIVADVAGDALRPNRPTGLRRVWTYNSKVIKRNVTEQDLAKEFVKAFLAAYRKVNR